MSSELTTTTAVLATVSGLADDWLAAHRGNTRKQYGAELRRFSAWLGRPGGEALLVAGSAGARRLALAYRDHLAGRGLAPATVNRALAALRSLVSLARDMELVDWSLRVPGLKARAYRDTTGWSVEGVRSILAEADSHPNARKAARDGALLRVVYGLGLRRGEAAKQDEAIGLRVSDVDGDRLWVMGKGCDDRAPLTMPGPVVEAIDRWLTEHHPFPAPGEPLFVSLDNRSRGAPLSTRSVARVVSTYAARAGLKAAGAHALRHSAITHGLDATEGDVRAVRAFSRHAKLETLMKYDDNRNDGAGRVAALLGGLA